MIKAIIVGTPTYVWFLLAVLVVRGLKLRNEAELNIRKMMIVPTLFIVWGLEKLFNDFSYLGASLAFYIIAAVIGSMIGYNLYQRNRRVFKRDEVIYRSGSYMPLTIILINFCVKYTLNVILAIHTELHQALNFNILYALFSGLSVGLFVGGIYQAFKAREAIQNR
ncbi:DUF6622 family protein [Fusibacter ferrireducens]|uniref:DUF1453 family protein n=1 Tax=Fusibacter ferrireducens TaxID=2785058 RepID=A0ABR9ZZV2_9FIRM|nr:DUF6622 family protein [Fusibacter ferrireducens]MBF4695984.1 DUF1453 family protein [Fusibacter ferrireducens]